MSGHQISQADTEKDLIAKEILQLFEHYGNEDYDGEPVSQTSHMVQCSMLATHAGSDQELALAALLHDIGHLLKHMQTTEAMAEYGVANHEGIGASYLRSKGFSERICAVVEKHVDAKRYLVATDSDYASRLSEASRKTLEYQGGAMTKEETEAFEQHPFFRDIIKVRKFDEQGKSKDAALIAISDFKHLIIEHLQKR